MKKWPLCCDDRRHGRFLEPICIMGSDRHESRLRRVEPVFGREPHWSYQWGPKAGRSRPLLRFHGALGVRCKRSEPRRGRAWVTGGGYRGRNRRPAGPGALQGEVTSTMTLQSRRGFRMRRRCAILLQTVECVLEIEALVDEFSLAARRRCDAVDNLDSHAQFTRKLAVYQLPIA